MFSRASRIWSSSLNLLYVAVLALWFSPQITSGQGLAALSFGTDDAFDVGTWNLEAFPKDGQATVDSVRMAIVALDFDVLGLQEINDTVAFRQMVQQMPGFSSFIADGFYAGLAYVYKTDAVEIQDIYKIYTAFPFWDIFPRAPVVMELTYQGESLVVINNHLKCCGDGALDLEDEMDEENRRYQASQLLKAYIDDNLPNSKVFVIGDLNDLLTDPPSDNVFQNFLDDSDHYQFADFDIALGTSNNWSFPLWPSHLDHILITDELFEDFANPNSSVQTIKADNFMSGGLWEYDEIISDHRPVALKIDFDPLTAIAEVPEVGSLRLYPNPGVGALMVDFGRQLRAPQLTLLRSDGRTAQVWQLADGYNAQINPQVAPGIYTLVVRSADYWASCRLLRQ